ncbi:MAG: hypothetical protein WBK95_06985 [Sulfurimonas sp.]|jgi:hypothetical protein|nr:hypothetical protein [Sulfurimonas sp.]MDD5202625.1 hypothetical protein [Sulfurimonas sp.]
MNEMYDMSIVTHNYGVIGILLVVFINLFLLMRAKEIGKYKRLMRLFTPISSLPIASVIFTGIVMMAAKHLAFSGANIAMILFAVAIIILEVKRAKKLKYLPSKEENALQNFKTFAIKIFFFELFLTLSISVWMWL